MSIVEHCPGEKPSADSPGCDEYFVVECDVCGECWTVGPKAEEILFDRHLCDVCRECWEVGPQSKELEFNPHVCEGCEKMAGKEGAKK